MTGWHAVFWGGFAASSLVIGAVLARPLAGRNRLIGQIMGFGAGTLLAAVAYELIPQAQLGDDAFVALSTLVGALTYFLADRLVDGSGGGGRQDITGADAAGGSGAAMFVGALLDGIPESFILGITIALGGSVSVAFVAAVFMSNIPEGIAGTSSLRTAGLGDRRIYGLWWALVISCAAVALLGFAIADSVPHRGLYADAFAGGAMLTMLADSMMPEAFEHGGRSVGLLTVVGYLVAGALAAFD